MTPASARLHNSNDSVTASNKGLDLTILVSCYNEERLIIQTLETVTGAMSELVPIEYEVIVIDDCSSDRSPQVIEEFIKAHPDKRLMLRANEANRGLAQNYVDGAFIGKGKYYRLICGDDAEPRETIAAVLSELGSADMLLPYYVSVEAKSLKRRILSAAYTALLNAVSGFHLHYYNGLPVHLRQNVMRWHTNTRGFGFQADIICMLLDQGCSYKEIPVRGVDRKEGGESRALTLKNLLSVVHVLLDVVIRRASNRINRWM